jgi:peptidoglycan/LPS O-acetylase OafA/YrhL
LQNDVAVAPRTAGWSGPRFQCLDGLRALAAIAIVLTHAASYSHTYRGVVGDYLSQLDTAVAVFFGLSGFLLYRPFALAHQAERPSGSVRHYALRRLTRIYPAYWIALAVFMYVLGSLRFQSVADTVFGFSLLQLYHSGTILQGLPQAWTLCVEITFYAFIPLYAFVIAKWARRNPFRTELVGIGLLTVIGIAVELQRELGGHPQGWTVGPLYLPLFASGMLLAVLSARQQLHGGIVWLDRVGKYAFVGVVIAFLSYACIIQVVGIHITTRPSHGQFVARYFLEIPLVLALLVPATFGTRSRGAVRGFLSHPVMLFLGTISYGIYLWHFPALVIVHDRMLGLGHHEGRLTVVFLLALGLTLVFATASWYLVERPLLRWTQRPRRPRQSTGERTEIDADVTPAVALEATN